MAGFLSTASVPSRYSTYGTVPVEENGSAALRAPAERPLYFQLLDWNGMSVMNMRTFVYLHPGETQSCTGCHEPRGEAPDFGTYVHEVRVRNLDPPAGPAHDGGLSFSRSVQPVLDRYCIWHAGRLARMLLDGDESHPSLGAAGGLDRKSLQRIVDWAGLQLPIPRRLLLE